MGDHKLNFISFKILLSLLFFILFHVSVCAQEDVCANVECGQGTCAPSKSSILGYNCSCDTGWKQFQLGPLIFPACVVPNCTINNSQCANDAPSPSTLPPPPLPLPPANLTSPCNLVWCGDGTCIANGTGHYCQCYDGATNLLNLTALPCYKSCSLGADCSVLGLVPYLTPLLPPINGLIPPPPSLLLPPPPSGPVVPSPPPNGSNSQSRCSRSYGLNIILLFGSILTLALVHTMPICY